MSSSVEPPRGPRLTFRLLAAALALAAVVALGVTAYGRAGAAEVLTLEVLSSRPDAVTGGDARVRVRVPTAMSVGKVRLTVDGVDATDRLQRKKRVLEGVVTGLRSTSSTLRAGVGTDVAVLIVRNHPRSGPLLAGPHELPFGCQSQHFKLATGELLGQALDEDCTVAPRVDYVYRSTETGTYRPLTGPALTDTGSRPADIATVTPEGGRKTPFIVRVETRTINRGIAEVAMLHDPARSTQVLWNSKLLYTLGGGCEGGWYVQGRMTSGVLSPKWLAAGYALASNSLNVFGNNCNDLLAAETLAMTREQFIEDHGVPDYVMGVGCSGGSYQAHQIADSYPGLLDGIVAGCSFADLASDMSTKLFDAHLLYRYQRTFPGRLTAEQLRLVSGFGSVAALQAMSDLSYRMDPQSDFDDDVPAGERYDPATNPRGARSTIWDHAVNVYGRVETGGPARRPLDNVGVQYGLQTLQDGGITLDEFLDLNQRVGGVDLDFRSTPERTAADEQAVRAAFRTGRVLNGGGGLDEVPIIDIRSYTEGPDSTDAHMRYHTFVTQERLVAANGDANNRVLLTVGAKPDFSLETGTLAAAVESMDQWLVALKKSGKLGHQAVVAAKPKDLVDACWTQTGEKLVQPQTYRGPGRCNELYPAFSAPRLVAGGPLSSDVLVCNLRPVQVADYPGPVSKEQLARLQAIYPKGVCDYTKPSRFRSTFSTWTVLR